MKAIELGTVIHGTMRLEDIMPAFAATLQHIEPHVDIAYITDNFAKPGYFKSDEANWDCACLFDTLNALAPKGTYFGAHEGDGCDYGFWPISERDQDKNALSNDVHVNTDGY